MFGVVPKPVWEREQSADKFNRIRLATNCVLARDGTHTVLVDTGFGDRHSPRDRRYMAMDRKDYITENFQAIGLSLEDVDTVVLSHLHFDHVGGSTRYCGGSSLVPTFPRATYVINRLEWEEATRGVPELRGAYRGEDFLPLKEAGRVRLVEDREVIVPGLVAQHTGGHTRGHQALRFESDGQCAVYLGDLCPTSSHMRMLWCMAYDMDPLRTRRTKPEFLREAADRASIVFWDHDPDMAAARIERHEKREFVVVDAIESL